MTVGERIRAARKAKGLTQKQLGEACGIAEPTIRRYELGKLNAIYCNRATYLNIKLNTLCCLQNYKNLLYIVSY